MGVLIAAPAQIDVEGPLVFLAGPIAWGTDSWHDRAVALFESLAPSIHVASPRRDLATSATLWNRREDAGDPHEVPTGDVPDRDFPDAAYNEQMD